ncbi:MAG: hypothetical protein ACQGVK_03505 [Myxococcota bacterium]
MPTFMAFVIAVLVGVLVDQALPATGDLPISRIVAMIAGFFAFYFAKRGIEAVRPDV